MSLVESQGSLRQGKSGWGFPGIALRLFSFNKYSLILACYYHFPLFEKEIPELDIIIQSEMESLIVLLFLIPLDF